MSNNSKEKLDLGVSFSRFALWLSDSWFNIIFTFLFYVALGFSLYASCYLMDNLHATLWDIFIDLWVYTFIAYVLFHRLSYKFFVGIYLFFQIPMLLFLPAKYIYDQFAYFNLAVMSFLNSNFDEGSEFIKLIPEEAIYYMLTFALLSALTLYLGKKAKSKVPAPFPKLSKAFTIILIGISLFGIFRNPYYIYCQKDSELSKGYQHPFSKVFTHTFSNNALAVMASYYYLAYEEISEINKQLKQKPIWEVTDVESKYKDYILIIGESASADYTSLYGYPVENSKFIKSYGKAKIAMNYYAPAPNTISSLHRLLTRQDSVSHKPILSDNILNLARQAGIKVYWLSMQRKIEGVNTSIGFVAQEADSAAFVSKEAFWSDKTKDSEILPIFEQAIKKKSEQTRLFILHLQGSHPSFHDRLEEPLHINHWSDNVSAYLQTIEQTDKLIEHIYKLSQKYSNSFSITYLSDHGMSPSGTIGLTHGNKRSSYHIPFYQLSSDDSQEQRFEPRKHGLNFIHGLANWLGIKEKHLKPNYSFFTPDKSDSTALFVTFDLGAGTPFDEVELAPILGKD